MTAFIAVELDGIHPVIGGRWHRVRFAHFPTVGEQIVTFCGTSATIEFADGPPAHINTCWGCDLVYRQQHDILALPDHPGLAELHRQARHPTPHPRSRYPEVGE
jgi:hypothetical protein